MKRFLFGSLAALTLTSLLMPQPASARHRDCDDDSYSYRRSSRYTRRYYDNDRYSRRYYDSDRYYRTRYDDDYGYGSRYDDECYTPRRRTVYYTRPSYSYTSYNRYRCSDCGDRFGSSRWLSYHRRHTSCD
jgi:hypothetical protein